jgi:hypothetical protein
MKNKKRIQAKLIMVGLSLFFLILCWYIIDQFIIQMSFLHFLVIEVIRSVFTKVLKWEEKRLKEWGGISATREGEI